MAILKEADARLPVGEVILGHSISSTGYDKWKAKYDGLDASELKGIGISGVILPLVKGGRR